VETLSAWWDGDADGVVNMATDEALGVAAERSGMPLIRFYGWSAPTVSLGAFQRLADARVIPDIASATLVRRPSGGGAIVHGSDLTYALAMPKSHPLGQTAQQLYTAAHETLAAVLQGHGIAARLSADPPHDIDFFCFSRRAGGDLVVAAAGREPTAADPKVMGSAQRRLAGAVVQHGSLLLRANPGVGPTARHPGLEDLHHGFHSLDLRQLASAWLDRLGPRLGARLRWEDGQFAATCPDESTCRTGAYADPRWLGRR
jgi:lipoate-protein ligase A